MSKLSCDIKYIHRARTYHKFIVEVEDEVTNYLVMIPLFRGTSHKNSEALINYVFCEMDPKFYIIFDKD